MVIWKVQIVSKKISFDWDEGWFGIRAAGVMLDGKNRVLLSRLEDEDVWVLPGGAISLHETLNAAVKREFLEEAKFEIEVHRLLWILENYFVFNGKRAHDIGFYFLVSPEEARGVWERDEFVGQEELHTHDRSWVLIFKWFDISKLKDLNLKPSVFIKLLKNIPKHPTHVVHNACGK